MAKDMFDDILDELFSGSLGAKLTGHIGESATAVELGFVRLLGKKGVTLRNLYIPKDDGTTTEIDLVYITPKGIFVIESKNYSGWIFGDEKDAQWTAMLPNRTKNRFYNPIRQNKGHIQYLKQHLQRDIPLISVIVFSQRCELKSIAVKSPLTYVIKRDDLYAVIRAVWKALPNVLDEARIKALCEQLRGLTTVTESVKTEHVQQVRAVRKQDAQTCPKCRGKLLLRTAQKGENAGKQFYGCENFPQCRYIRNL